MKKAIFDYLSAMIEYRFTKKNDTKYQCLNVSLQKDDPTCAIITFNIREQNVRSNFIIAHINKTVNVEWELQKLLARVKEVVLTEDDFYEFVNILRDPTMIEELEYESYKPIKKLISPTKVTEAWERFIDTISPRDYVSELK